ncbi:MAG: SDR family oxidoreductase [Candidatus Dojkabacteria bacterium]|nr:MAG: SDR family oxidoreductase [Candidatus Dojkabacteria bacterium]
MDPLTPLSELINLKGKLAIVTGATSGIGKGIANRLAEAGADLILISRTEADLKTTAEEFAHYGVNIQTFALDVGVKEKIDDFWQKIAEQTPNILVNNAGIYPFGHFLETDQGLYQKVMDVNLNSSYWMCFNFIKKLTEADLPGNIVNIGSIEAVMPLQDGLIHYSISKAGVIALTRGLARDFGEKHIRVNAILPGGIKTGGTSEIAKDLFKLKLGLLQDAYNFQQRLPLGRIGEPDDVAKVALMLVSDISSYMTGAIVPVDGGFLSS